MRREKKQKETRLFVCLCLPLSLLRHVIVMMLTGRVGAMTSRLTQTPLPMPIASPLWLLTVTYLVPFAAASAAWRRNGQHDITISVVAGVCLHLSHTPAHIQWDVRRHCCIWRALDLQMRRKLCNWPWKRLLCGSVCVCMCVVFLCSCLCGLLVIHGRAAYR